MRDIIIYKAEASIPGLAEKIAQARVIAYTMPVEIWKPEEVVKSSVVANLSKLHSLAGIHDNDLYYTKSILVTTNWNKNTDVFDKLETWQARSTPSHKPTNVEHDEKQTVGHITNCYAMDLEGNIIPDNTLAEDLPNVYHLVNGAVIYRGWRESDLIARANKLIEDIEAGKKYVSMECTFTNFGYALLKDNKSYIVERSEATAWMTKHLRAYGGNGECDGYKIGRLLRNITFSGKGYVDKPANPDSIIFNNASLFDFSSAKENPPIINSGVYFNRQESHAKEIDNMDIEVLKTQLDEVKQQLAEATLAKTAAEEKLAKADVAKAESRITELETQLKSITEQAEASQKAADEAIAKITILENTITEAKTVNNDLTQKLAEIAQAQIVAGRISVLVDGGIDKEIAAKKVALYANLSDEQFTDLAADLVEAAKKSKEDEKKKAGDMPPDKAKCSDQTIDVDDTTVTDTVLDTATVVDEPALSTAGDQVDETAELRKELQAALAGRLGIKLGE